MARTTEEKQFGDLTARCTKHPALEALRLKAQLLKLVAPALGDLNKLDMRSLAASQTELGDLAALGPVIASLLRGLSPDDLEAAVKGLLRHTTVITAGDKPVKHELSKPSAIDAAFEDLDVMFEVLAWVLEVNFHSFFQKIGARLGGALAGRTAATTVTSA